MTKKRKITILALLIAFFLIVALFSLYMLYSESQQRKKSIEEFEYLTSLVEKDMTVQEAPAPANPTLNEPEGETAPEPDTVTVRDLQPLFDMNPDCLGWISIPDTRVNYPVMHTPDDPEKYLRLSFEGKYNSAGVPFIDGRCNLDNDHLIIYGHNMMNGTMFADLKKYIDEDFLKGHPCFEFQTAEGTTRYEIFAILLADSRDYWYFFNNAADEEDFNTTLWDVANRSFHYTGIVPKYGEKLITLSTCYGRDDDDRLLVVGREVK